MSAIADIVALLEKVPIWKRLKELPDRFDKLEKRVVELESILSGSSGDRCPKCGKPTFELANTRPHPTFGNLGVQERTYTCSSCGFSEPRTIE